MTNAYSKEISQGETIINIPQDQAKSYEEEILEEILDVQNHHTRTMGLLQVMMKQVIINYMGNLVLKYAIEWKSSINAKYGENSKESIHDSAFETVKNMIDADEKLIEPCIKEMVGMWFNMNVKGFEPHAWTYHELHDALERLPI